MNEPDLNWPPMGRVGFCRGGERAGTFIFLYALTGVEDPDFVLWEAHFQPPIEHSLVTEESAHHSDGFMQQWVRDWDVEWAPDELDPLVEARLFGERASWPETDQKHRNMANAASQAANTAAVYGRASSPASLGALVRQARERLGVTPADLVADPIISARGLTISDVQDTEEGLLAEVQKVIYLLEGLDLDLAIVSKRGGLLCSDSDPWAEFR